MEPERRTPRAAPQRVAVVHRQARRTLVWALGLGAAAGATAVVPGTTSAWVPLHLFLAGTLLLAISGATQLFAATWGAGPPGSDQFVGLQRALVGGGAVALVAARELGAPAALAASGGAAVLAGLLLLAGLLWWTVRRGVQRRFDSALRWYLAAIACGIGGTVLGMVMVLSPGAIAFDRVRDAHLGLNLLGLVGFVVLGTLPFFVATEARTRMSPRATPRTQGAVLALAATALGITAAAALAGSSGAAAAGLAAYATAIGATVAILPRIRAKHRAWAGPRLALLGAGLAWWLGAVLTAAVRASGGQRPWSTSVVLAVAVGGFGQILLGALAYLGPVLRGGGARRLAEGFATTRSWPALVAANVTAAGLAAGLGGIAVAGAAVLGVDVAVRATRLARGAGQPPSSGTISRQ